MKYKAGTILLIRNFKLPTCYKDKLFIVIGNTDKEVELFAITTSQIYFNAPVKKGLICDNGISVYCFPANLKIGEKGFSFDKDTFISHRSSIFEFNEDFLMQCDIKVMDILKREELYDLIYSLYRHSELKRKYKRILENILWRMNH